jgi:hypothetical protein
MPRSRPSDRPETTERYYLTDTGVARAEEAKRPVKRPRGFSSTLIDTPAGRREVDEQLEARQAPPGVPEPAPPTEERRESRAGSSVITTRPTVITSEQRAVSTPGLQEERVSAIPEVALPREREAGLEGALQGEAQKAKPVSTATAGEAAVGDAEGGESTEQYRRGDSDRAEPSVVVDMGSGTEPLVEQLCNCAPDQEASIVDVLLRAGEAVLPMLVQRFPGTVWFKRGQQHQRLPAGRDVSAVARAVLAFGDEAAPYVRSLLFSSDPDIRFYALLLSGDLGHPSLMEPLVQRLFDADEHIRRVAMEMLFRFKEVSGFAETLKSLRDMARATGRPNDMRATAIEALSGLRDTGSFDLLLSLLEGRDKRVTTAAHRALVALTLQDFGFSEKKWATWLNKNRGRDRIEWLIDGLTHADQTIRASAGTELQRLTNTYFGYHPTSSRRDRKKAQQRYRDWWEAERGKR